MLQKQFQALWEHTDPSMLLGLERLLGGVVVAETEK